MKKWEGSRTQLSLPILLAAAWTLSLYSCAAGAAGRKVPHAEASCTRVGTVFECVGAAGTMTLVPGPTPAEVKDLKSKKDAYRRGYQDGKTLADEMRRDYHDSARARWRKAFIHKVRVPAQVKDGLYIEEHEEPFMIRPPLIEEVQPMAPVSPPSEEETKAPENKPEAPAE